MYYYVQKQGTYPQGVYWIGESEEQAVIEAKRLACEDTDSYHTWDVHLYTGELPWKPLRSFRKSDGPLWYEELTR